MDRILYCITFQHDWRWTLAAGLVCVFGVGTAYQLLGRARASIGIRRRNLAMLAALTGGLAVFTTHYMAMQGYDAGGDVRYDVWPTISSFFMAFASIGLACLANLARSGPVTRALGAALAMSGVAAMHFLGVAALELPGLIVWRADLAALSVLAGIVLASTSAAFLYGSAPWRRFAAGGCGAVAVVVLHFGAMSAMSFEPRTGTEIAPWTLTPGLMTLVLAGMMLGIAAVAGVAIWMWWMSRASALGQLRQAIEAMPDGLAFYDGEDRLVLWNTRYAEVNPELSTTLKRGMTFREILQIGIDEGLYAEAVGREAEWIEERMSTRAARLTSLEQQIAGDRWLRVSDRRTVAGGTVTICTDITELKRDARALADARDAAQAANGAKSQFLANMSHEIRTPLNGVIGIAQALANTDLSARQKEMLDLIQSSSRTLQVLLSDILDLARVESGRLELNDEAFDLGRAVREAAQLYEASARDKGLQFFVEIAPEVDRWIEGDVVRLKQILTNLVSNSVKFTEQGFVSLTALPGPMREGKPTLQFAIDDTGIGFDSETRARLFSRFEQADGGITRKFGGSGLGLSISRQLADMMGGELDCESEPGGGSCFILTVPLRLAEAPVAATVEDSALAAGDDRRLRVLIADDHPVNRKVVEMILSQAEIDLTTVEDGSQALNAMRDGDYDLVLMDMQMPVMDGLTATREIRLHEAAMGLPRTPVVMLTANALPEHIASAEAAGADRHLAKPFDAAELLELVISLPRAAQAALAA
ncbi:response regulator [Brevundimonas sp. M20]|uniref:response regulator n=1 Tax=Brevundimonas sp. M20 TaxID=2591463 RepID=UPI00114739DF|nr:response regulator [Brevundimonas sp. M20]QDH73870.1 response regulator [Brevundimonas sp. M20]